MQIAIQDPLALTRLDRRRRGNLPVRENENVALKDLGLRWAAGRILRRATTTGKVGFVFVSTRLRKCTAGAKMEKATGLLRGIDV